MLQISNLQVYISDFQKRIENTIECKSNIKKKIVYIDLDWSNYFDTNNHSTRKLESRSFEI